MIIFKHQSDLSKFLRKAHASNQSVGFVPTMGALHKGHVSLVRLSQTQVSLTIVSIFVNPLQFNDPKDYIKYPVNNENDIQILVWLDVDALFLPSQEEMYPQENMKHTCYELGFPDTILEGAFRPGHFQGVCRVMDRLLTIVHPDNLYLGQKDFQQVMVIKKLISILDIPVKTIAAPIVREANGLAMSSRNVRLSHEFKLKAPIIFDQLQFIKNNRFHKSFPDLRNSSVLKLQEEGFEVEYLALAKASDLTILDNFSTGEPMILLIAVFAGNIRLIDNLLL